MMLYGIDISNWQSGLDIAKLPSYLDFIIVKATEGTTFVDCYCNSFVQALKAGGKLWGFYHFAYFDEPESEAQFFYDNCRNYFGDGIPVLDYEVNNYDNREWCERFISKLHDLSGVWPLLYISAYRVPEYADSWIPQKCGLWIAGYPYPATFFDEEQEMPYSTGSWECAAIWQFTSSLQLACYDGNLDGDYAYMDAEAWHRYAGRSATPKPALSYTELCKQIMRGEWGDNEERWNSLLRAGYDPDAAQDMINDYYALADEIIDGKWGNGWNRKNALEGAGYDYELAQMCVNALLEG